jgi:hypothetical protein
VIGEEGLIRMRTARKRPKAVWVWVGINRSPWAALWVNYSDLWAHPEVCIEPKDRIDSLDLRFLVGLQVHIDGHDTTERLFAAHLAALKAGAKEVFTLHKGELIFDKGEEYAIS